MFKKNRPGIGAAQSDDGTADPIGEGAAEGSGGDTFHPGSPDQSQLGKPAGQRGAGKNPVNTSGLAGPQIRQSKDSYHLIS